MSSKFLTLEGPPGPALGPTGQAPDTNLGIHIKSKAQIAEEAAAAKEKITTGRELDPGWTLARRKLNQYDGRSYNHLYTFIGVDIQAAHEEGGCLNVRPAPGEPWKMAGFFDEDEGIVCWPPKWVRPRATREDLYLLEPERGQGLSPLFFQSQERPGLITSLYQPKKWEEYQAKREWASYVDAKEREAHDKGLSLDLQMDMISQGYDPNNPQDLAGFWGRMKQAFTPPRKFRKWTRRAFQPSGKVKRAVTKGWRKSTRFVKKGVRYAGAATVGAFMTARARNKTFGLRGHETGQFEIGGKVVRGVIAAVAVVATGGTILALKAQAAGVGAGAGAGAAGAGAAGAAGGTAFASAAGTTVIPTVTQGAVVGTTSAGLPVFAGGTGGLSSTLGMGTSLVTPTAVAAVPSAGFLAKIGALASGIKSKAIAIGKVGTNILAVKNVAGQLFAKEVPIQMVEEGYSVPDDGFIYDPSFDPMYEGGFMGGFPQYPAGQQSALLPWGDEETPESEFESDAPLKDAITAAGKEPEIKPLAVMGVAMLLLAVSRRS